MTVGNLQYGTGNNSGNDPTTLTSAASPHTLAAENTAFSHAAVVGRGNNQGHGVAGYSNGCSFPEGCFNGAGVYGENTGTGYGVRGWSPGVGVGGYSGGASPGVDGGNWSGGDGVDGFSTRRNGVQGASESRAASGVYGENMSGGGFGVAGRSNARSLAAGAAVLGDNTAGGFAGIFNGAVRVNGMLSKSGGGFRIDHPLDPARSYLNHSFVESPDMMNIYNGNVTTDAEGNAVVDLPSYFEALNRDFRYQLTVIGVFAQAIVAEELRDNRFSIRTDKPDVRVSWQVTGVRQDAWANSHRPEAEETKPEDEQDRYLAPEEHGQPVATGLFYVEAPTGVAPREQTGTAPGTL
ncbi:hypothetical protein ACFQ7F_16275 [Streptomyces sp. NPDC056486]|uniref:hypothetical protein n=1 Tax=Streptomyces sp. NPDC056486 TaxID=3345835 RepID=UPI0036880A6E